MINISTFTWLQNRMTSNTTPSPYRVFTSGQYDSTYAGWKAFNGTNNGDTDLWSSDTNNGYITFDMGDVYAFGAIAITSRNGTLLGAPRDFKVLYSDDNINFKEALSVQNSINWASNERREFYFPSNKVGRYIRIDVSRNNSRVRLDIGEINIYYSPIFRKSIISSNNSYYSITSEDTLVQLPNNLSSGIIRYGIDVSSVIDLNKQFIKNNYVTYDDVSGSYTDNIVEEQPFNIFDVISKNFKIIHCSNVNYDFKLIQNGIRNPQLAFPKSDISLNGVSTIDSLNLLASSDAKIAISFDRGITWKSYKDNSWTTIESAFEGMTNIELNQLTSEQIELARNGSTNIRFSYGISNNAYIDKLEMKVSLQGYEKIADSKDYTLSYDQFNKTLIYSIKKDGTYSVNYIT